MFIESRWYRNETVVTHPLCFQICSELRLFSFHSCESVSVGSLRSCVFAVEFLVFKQHGTVCLLTLSFLLSLISKQQMGDAFMIVHFFKYCFLKIYFLSSKGKNSGTSDKGNTCCKMAIHVIRQYMIL